MIKTIKFAAATEFPNTVSFRRYLHQNPRLSFQEEDTVRYLSLILTQAGIPFEYCGKNGILAHLKGSRPGPKIAFRSDFDALSIQEPSGLSFASNNPGVMHACGHDAHAAVLLSFARILQEHREWLAGEVVCIFQYAEETPPGGAAPMIEAGCLNGVERIYGLHVSDELEVGTIGICAGKYMAASDSFSIEFLGDGGHGSRPGETQDTVSAAANAIIQINTIISRFISPLNAAVISVCNIHGGDSYNVIPSKVRLEGTVRTYEPETAALIQKKIENAAKTSAEIYGTNMLFTFKDGYPVLVNHMRECAVVSKAAEKLGLPLRNIQLTPVGEDFARYLQKIPGAFFRVGIRNPKINAVYPLHNSQFALDESGMEAALEMFLSIYLLETEQM